MCSLTRPNHSLANLTVVLLLAAAELRAGTTGLIQVPIRWCAIEGTPAATNPAGVGEPDTDNVLWRRHERASDRIWIPRANITFRSAFTSQIKSQASFPIIPDPNPPAAMGGTGPGVLGDILDIAANDPRDPNNMASRGRELREAVASCEAAWNTLATQFAPTPLLGLVGINLRRFVNLDNSVASLAGNANFSISFPGGTTQAQVCQNPTLITQNSGNIFASVIDNSFTLVGDPTEKLLGHELGHVLFLGHGNGLDDEPDGVYDQVCDLDENVNALPASIMTPSVPASTEVITALQRNTARAVGRVTSGAQIDPPGSLVNGDTVSDQRVDAVHDVTVDSVDLVNVTMAVNTVTETTFFSHKLFGTIPIGSTNQYLVFADLDGNPNTGGAPLEPGCADELSGRGTRHPSGCKAGCLGRVSSSGTDDLEVSRRNFCRDHS